MHRHARSLVTRRQWLAALVDAAHYLPPSTSLSE